jgi:hypothetical protein
MVERLPAHYIELVSDALLKSYWRRQALWSFLRRSGISASFLATWDQSESKRAYLARLFPEVEVTNAGLRLINRMADALVQQTTFPDLEGWEDSDHKKELARSAVLALHRYMEDQRRKAEIKHTNEASRRRAVAIQEESQKRQMNLQKLSNRLTDLSKALGTQRAGYDFQVWFYDLVDFFEVVSRRPYVSDGRQIDGSITVDGTTYLVELKFTKEQADAPDVDIFFKKVSNKADNTMGIMVSISGFSNIAVKEASGPKTPLLLFDHTHVFALLGGTITLEELVCRVRRHCSQTGQAYLSLQEFGG